jgi:hypothetical protein
MSTDMTLAPPAPDGLGEGAPRGLPAAFLPPHPPFLTEKTRGCRLG